MAVKRKRMMIERHSKVRDININDEFKTVLVNDRGQLAARTLLQVPKGVVLVLNERKDRVRGVITAGEFLRAIAEGIDPTRATAADIMNTDIMEIGLNDTLEHVVPLITEKDPYAVIVTDTDGMFRGYFSPKDYQEALERIQRELA